VAKWLMYGVVAMLLAGLARADEDSLRVSGIEANGAGIRLRLACPILFTNRLDILSCSNLLEGHWTVLASGLSTEATNALSWIDSRTALAGPVFYRIGNHDVDSDSDGVSDGDERLRGTDPHDPADRAVVFFADSDIGDDANDGLSARLGNGHGPKLHIAAVHQRAFPGDTISMSGNDVFVEPGLCLGSHDVRVRPVGRIVVRP
jgi:hypothetical protein